MPSNIQVKLLTIILAALGFTLVIITSSCGGNGQATLNEKSDPYPAPTLGPTSFSNTPSAPGPSPTSEPLAPSPTSTPNPNLLPPIPTPTIDVYPDITWYVPPSLEEQIFGADVIARASLLSTTAATETIPSEDEGVAPTYRPVQILRFTVHEYLKGSGPSEVLVDVPGDYTYLTEAAAHAWAADSLARRNTAWDQRQAVLFLSSGKTRDALTVAMGDGALDSAQSAPVKTHRFRRSNPLESAWDYTVENLSRAWLPAEKAESFDQASDSGNTAASLGFITDGSESPPPLITLETLKTKIAEMAATLTAGEGVEGYRSCIVRKILRERHRRAQPWYPPTFAKRFASGSAAGSEVYRESNTDNYPQYHNWWLSGPNAKLFKALIIDDDSSSSNGYDYGLAIARPLPNGTYRVFYNRQHYLRFPCNHKPEDAYLDWTVTVTPPSWTLHEAFFDPVSLASGVGVSGSLGIIKPASFSLGGKSISISGLRWENGSVVLTLSPHSALSGHTLHFIALDGSIALSLSTDSATSDSSAGTLTWSASEQPWKDGDLLMLRISEPLPRLSVEDASDTEGGLLEFGVTLSKVSTEEVTVNYVTRDVTATDPVDYRGTTGTVTFKPGEVWGVVFVLLRDDEYQRVEGDETLELVLTGASGAEIEDGVGVGTIRDSH